MQVPSALLCDVVSIRLRRIKRRVEEIDFVVCLSSCLGKKLQGLSILKFPFTVAEWNW